MANDETFLRRAIQLASQAREKGEDPFGAVLVFGQDIVHEAYDRSIIESDPTYHAELGLISEYCRNNDQIDLEGYTIYSSTEPCAMCSGAIHWAKISRVVFSVSQKRLQEISGGRPKYGCEEILNSGRNKVEIVKELLVEEGLKVFDGYKFIPKAERHKSLLKDQ